MRGKKTRPGESHDQIVMVLATALPDSLLMLEADAFRRQVLAREAMMAAERGSDQEIAALRAMREACAVMDHFAKAGDSIRRALGVGAPWLPGLREKAAS